MLSAKQVENKSCLILNAKALRMRCCGALRETKKNEAKTPSTEDLTYLLEARIRQLLADACAKTPFSCMKLLVGAPRCRMVDPHCAACVLFVLISEGRLARRGCCPCADFLRLLHWHRRRWCFLGAVASACTRARKAASRIAVVSTLSQIMFGSIYVDSMVAVLLRNVALK